MPFKSQAQVRALFAKDPKLAKEWVRKYGLNYEDLPDHVKQHGKRRKPEHKK